MAKNAKAASAKRRKRHQHRAHWVSDQIICSCRSRTFTILRERVVRKNRTRHSHRKRHVGICGNGHKTRIGFPSGPRRK